MAVGLPRTGAHPTLQRVSSATGLSTIPQLPAPGVLTPASLTRQREHDRRLRTLRTRMQRATLKRRLEHEHDPSLHPVGNDALVSLSIPNDILSQTTGGFGWGGGLLGGLRRFVTGSAVIEEDRGVHTEFDTDIVDALVYTVGRWMGLDIEQLRDSPGLRTLVSRNIEWFRSSPDWMKLAGLILAKKLNKSLDCPLRSLRDTQRMPYHAEDQGSGVTQTEEAVDATTEPVDLPEASVTQDRQLLSPTEASPHTKKRRMTAPTKKKKTAPTTTKTRGTSAQHRGKRLDPSIPKTKRTKAPTPPTLSSPSLSGALVPMDTKASVDADPVEPRAHPDLSISPAIHSSDMEDEP